MNEIKPKLMSTGPTPTSTDPWYRLRTDDNSPCIVLTGNYTFTALEHKLDLLSTELAMHAQDKNLAWDLTGIEQMDAVGTAVLWRAWQAQRPKRLQLRPEQKNMFERL